MKLRVKKPVCGKAHKKYIDIHILMEEEKKICVSEMHDIKVLKPCNEDYTLFEREKRYEVLLKSNSFLVLYPNEIHKTSIIAIKKCKIRKTVLNLKI
jgi:YhcH/YjgK/YiaL family protein